MLTEKTWGQQVLSWDQLVKKIGRTMLPPPKCSLGPEYLRLNKCLVPNWEEEGLVPHYHRCPENNHIFQPPRCFHHPCLIWSSQQASVVLKHDRDYSPNVYRWGNWSSKGLSYLPKFSQLVNSSYTLKYFKSSYLMLLLHYCWCS